MRKIKKGLNFSLLKKGTKILVETVNSFYELTVVEGKKAKIYGGTQPDGTIRFQKPTPAIFVGSGKEDFFLTDWLGPNLAMRVMFDDNILKTSLIQKVTIETPEWSYSIE